MKVLILEDEPRAANHLKRLLLLLAPELQVVAVIDSVGQALQFLGNQPEPDLLFSDIQLADGLSFEIFNQHKVRCPILFTTAYDHYAIEAFKTNGIDYLLKPLEEERLKQALEKAAQFTPSLFQEKLHLLQNRKEERAFKLRFIVKIGDKIKSIPTEDVLLFYSQEKGTFLHSTSGHTYTIDYTMDQLESSLDPANFFRINRKYIVSIQACTTILAWTNSRLRLKIEGISDPEIFVARERVQEFKNWLDR